MKVSELIILLLDCNPEAEVGYYESDGYDGVEWTTMNDIEEVDGKVQL